MHKSDINKIDRSVELPPVSESMISSLLEGTYLTTDNGSEFPLLPKLEVYGIHIYYAHAHHSWEKGSNERHNRML